jgi:hypothetical protein
MSSTGNYRNCILFSAFSFIHALLTSLYAWHWQSGYDRALPIELMLAWFVWPFVILITGLKKRLSLLALLPGFIALLPAIWYAFIQFIFSGGM